MTQLTPERSSAEGHVAFVGGTGAFGSSLALRLAMSGLEVRIGSRDRVRGAAAAAELQLLLERAGHDAAGVSGDGNAAAAIGAAVVIVTAPFGGLHSLLTELRPVVAARVVVSCVVPMEWGEAGPSLVTVDEGSAAELVAAMLPESTVVAGFHSVSSSILRHPTTPIDSDVVLCGEDPQAKAIVAGLAERIEGARAVDAGGLRNARYAEGLAVLLLSINRLHRAHAGVIITDLPGR